MVDTTLERQMSHVYFLGKKHRLLSVRKKTGNAMVGGT